MFTPTHNMTRGKPCGIEKIDHAGPHRSIASIEKIAAKLESHRASYLEYQRQYNVDRGHSGTAKTCDVCGGPCYSQFKVCRKTKACVTEYGERWGAHLKEQRDRRDPVKICEICGVTPLPRTSRHGVCHANPDCARENHRRRNKARNDDYLGYMIWRERVEADNDYKITYLMWSPGLNTHKIGITNNIDKRLAHLRNGCWDIELVTTFPYGRPLERWLHNRFDASRIPKTEWFTDLTETDVKNAVAEFEREI